MPTSPPTNFTLGNLRIVVEAQRTESIRTLQQQFGDGYVARRPDGINTSIEEWQVVTRPLRSADAASLEAEIRALGGGPFVWTPPTESVPKKWVLEPVQWARRYLSTEWSTLSFNIKRWYD